MSGKESYSAEWYRQRAATGKVSNKGRLIVDIPPPNVSVPPRADLAPQGPKRNKYGAISVEDPEGGQKFPSRFEFKNATELRNRVRAGEIMSVGRQVMVYLAPGITWTIDFVIQYMDETVEYVETKGKDTADFLLKEKLFRDKYPHIKLTIKRAREKRKRG